MIARSFPLEMLNKKVMMMMMMVNKENRINKVMAKKGAGLKANGNNEYEGHRYSSFLSANPSWILYIIFTRRKIVPAKSLALAQR